MHRTTRWLSLTLLTAIFAIPSFADTVAFTDILPGAKFGGGFSILGTGNTTFPGTYQSVADPFVAAAGGILSRIDLGLFSSNGMSPVKVSLYTDVNNRFGALVFTSTVSREALYGSTALTTLKAGSGSLVAGNSYFLFLEAATPESESAWAENNTGARGPLLIGSFNTYTWLENQKLSAFDIRVKAATVPEPSTWMMAGAECLCLFGLAAWKRRTV